MRRGRVQSSTVLAVVVWALLAAVCSPACAAAVRWSGPSLVDRSSGVQLQVQACSPQGECVAFDAAGRLLTYPGQSPRRAHVAATDVPVPAAMACPTQTQCTAGTRTGVVVTFDPSDPMGAPTPVALPGYRGPVASIACPSTVRCVAIDADSQAITFDPNDPSAWTAVTVDGQNLSGLDAVSCPASSQCVALGSSPQSGSFALTFDPAVPADGSEAVLSHSDLGMSELACASTTQCVAAGEFSSTPSSDVELSFDPLAPSPTAPRKIADGVVAPQLLGGLACSPGGTCALLDQSGSVITFDPATGSSQTTRIDRVRRGSAGLSPGNAGLTAVQCVASTPCLAVDAAGSAIAFDPNDPSRVTRTLVDPGAPLSGVTCRSESLCVVNGHQEAGVFALRRPDRVTFHRIITGIPTDAQCPEQRLCVVAVGRSERTFLPGRRIRRTPSRRLAGANADPITLRCPTARECVVLYRGGRVVSFHPGNGGVIRRNDDGGALPQALACPSASQCTAIDQFGAATTFDPRTGRRLTNAVDVDRTVHNSNPENGRQVDDLACLNVDRCVTVDTLGDAVSFDPRHRGYGRAVKVDANETLTAVACAGGRCTTGDSDGRVLTGRPGGRHWVLTSLRLAGRITGVSCPNRHACAAADDIGHLYETTPR